MTYLPRRPCGLDLPSRRRRHAASGSAFPMCLLSNRFVAMTKPILSVFGDPIRLRRPSAQSDFRRKRSRIRSEVAILLRSLSPHRDFGPR